MRLVQLTDGTGRRVGLVEEPTIRLLGEVTSVYALAKKAVKTEVSLTALVERYLTDKETQYDPIYRGRSEWRLLPPVDHPEEPARCLVSGTGLTHLGSASDRQEMHDTDPDELTDSMQMFRWGVQSGRPEPGEIGVAPEWFYKGPGTLLRAQGEPLRVPPYAEDGGEEAEIAGIYVIGPEERPYRVGMAAGNEFADHEFEQENYLNLAGSKLRTCSLGPEIVIDPDFHAVSGRSVIERDGEEIWSKDLRTGESEMCHSLQNIEHHHFKFEPHRRPGDVHVHFFGAHSLSFGDGVRLQDGDVMEVWFEGYGRPLRNSVRMPDRKETLVTAHSLS